MTNVETSIGNRFQDFFLENFSGFESHTGDGDNVPDFYNPKYGFWVETKVGNVAWGARLKPYQRQSFLEISEPVVYFFGLHDFDNAKLRLRRKSEKQRQTILRKRMNILETYLVEKELIDKIFDKEVRTNEKATIEYCMIKRHIFRDVILNRSFRRFGKKISSAEDYYGFNLNDFAVRLMEIPLAPLNLAGLAVSFDNIGVRSYLQEKGIF